MSQVKSNEAKDQVLKNTTVEQMAAQGIDISASPTKQAQDEKELAEEAKWPLHEKQNDGHKTSTEPENAPQSENENYNGMSQ